MENKKEFTGLIAQQCWGCLTLRLTIVSREAKKKQPYATNE